MTEPQTSVDALLGATQRQRRGGRLVLLAAAGVAAVLLLGRCVYGGASPYFTAPVTRGDIAAELTLRGTLHGADEVTIAAAQEGTVVSVPDPAAARLRAGQELVVLDTAPLVRTLGAARAEQALAEAAVAPAQQALQAAQQRLERFDMVWHRSGGRVPSLDEMAGARADLARTQRDAADAQTRADAARASVALDMAALANARSLSPFAGYLVGCMVRVGQWVRPGQPLCTLVAHPEQLRVEAPLGAGDAARLPAGAAARVLVDGLADSEFPARLTGVAANQASLALSLPQGRAGAPMPAPGRGATVRVALAPRHDVLLAPAAALAFRLDGETKGRLAGVYVVQGNEPPRLVPVVAGASDGRQVEVLSSALKEGDQVVIGWRR